MPQQSRTRVARIALVVMAAALLQPLAQAQIPAKSPQGPAPSAGASSSMPGGGMDMKAMMKDMSDKMSSMQTTGNPDIDFAMMMRAHHQGAIDMAQAELKSGKDPQMRKMATGIISAQKKEIAQIDKFLAKTKK